MQRNRYESDRSPPGLPVWMKTHSHKRRGLIKGEKTLKSDFVVIVLAGTVVEIYRQEIVG